LDNRKTSDIISDKDRQKYGLKHFNRRRLEKYLDTITVGGRDQVKPTQYFILL
jgi:hypothetical protein